LALEEAVSDAILTKSSPDAVLRILLDVIFASIRTNRHVFDNPLTEPVLYRRMVDWVKNAIEEASKIERLLKDASVPTSG